MTLPSPKGTMAFGTLQVLSWPCPKLLQGAWQSWQGLRRESPASPCPLQQKPQGSEVSGPGHEGFQLHGGRSPLRPPTLLLSSRLGWPQLPSLMSPEPRVGLAVGIYTGAEATSRSSALWGQPLGSDWTVAQDSGGLPGGAFHWLEAEDPVCQEPCLAVGSVAVQPPSAG